MEVGPVEEDTTSTTLKLLIDGIDVTIKKFISQNNHLNISIQTLIFYFTKEKQWISHGAFSVIEEK